MKTEVTRLNWEDIIFESRNKEYGAYFIRKSYDKNVAKASMIVMLFLSFVLGVIHVASLRPVEIKTPTSVDKEGNWVDPPTIIPDPPIKRRDTKAEQAVNRDLLERVVMHEVEPTPVKPLETTSVRQEETGTGSPTEGIESGGRDAVTPVIVDPPKIIDFAEVMPEYQGGMSAMMKFLQKNLKYPASARRMAIEGTVFVRFVVNSDGDVVNVEVIKGISAVLDNEARHVIASMAKWKPGLQHGAPVNVRMVLPIKFKLEE